MNRTEKLTPKRIAFYERHKAGYQQMVGRQYGSWTVLSPGERNKWGQRMMKVLCSCGTVSSVSVKTLRNGDSTSCGCLKIEKTIQRSTIHGRCGSREYISWKAMLQRCTDPHADNYRYYGGLGIMVCDRWQEFSSFFEDMGPKPTTKHSIDRINPFGNYEPSNCRWATALEQANNKRGRSGKA